MEKITIFRANDGRTFESEKECKNHEVFCKNKDILKEFLCTVFTKDFFTYVRGENFNKADFIEKLTNKLEKDQETLESIISRFKELSSLNSRNGQDYKENSLNDSLCKLKYNNIQGERIREIASNAESIFLQGEMI